MAITTHQTTPTQANTQTHATPSGPQTIATTRARAVRATSPTHMATPASAAAQTAAVCNCDVRNTGGRGCSREVAAAEDASSGVGRRQHSNRRRHWQERQPWQHRQQRHAGRRKRQMQPRHTRQRRHMRYHRRGAATLARTTTLTHTQPSACVRGPENVCNISDNIAGDAAPNLGAGYSGGRPRQRCSR